MVASVFVLAAPVALLAAGGVGVAAHLKSKQLLQEKKRLYQKRLAQAEKRLGELDRLFIRIYEDNVAGRLDDERFAMMSRNYTGEQKNLKAEVKGLQQQIHEQEQRAENIEQFVQRVRRNSALTELPPLCPQRACQGGLCRCT